MRKIALTLLLFIVATICYGQFINDTYKRVKTTTTPFGAIVSPKSLIFCEQDSTLYYSGSKQLSKTSTINSSIGVSLVTSHFTPVITNPVVDDHMMYDGTKWVNMQPTNYVSAGAGIQYFYNDSTVLSTYEYLARQSKGNEIIDSVTVNHNGTLDSVLIDSYITDTLNRTFLNGGIYTLNTFSKVDNTTDITWMKYCFWLRHKNGTTTKLFCVNGKEINETIVFLHTTSYREDTYSCLESDRLYVEVWAHTTHVGNVNVSFYHGGNSSNSWIETPFETKHNDLSGEQGGTTTQRYHLSASEYTTVTDWTSGTDGITIGNRSFNVDSSFRIKNTNILQYNANMNATKLYGNTTVSGTLVASNLSGTNTGDTTGHGFLTTSIATKLAKSDTTSTLLTQSKSAKTYQTIAKALINADTTSKIPTKAFTGKTYQPIGSYWSKSDTTGTLLTQSKASNTYRTIATSYAKTDTASTLLTQTKASGTYRTIANSWGKSDTTSTLLTQAKASKTYQTIALTWIKSDTTSTLSTKTFNTKTYIPTSTAKTTFLSGLNSSGTRITVDTAIVTLGNIGFPYAELNDTTTQTIGSTSTAYAITFDKNKYISNITHSTSTNPSRITIPIAGTYEISLDAQALVTSGQPQTMDFWLAVGGVNDDQSNHGVSLTANNVVFGKSMHWVYTFTAGQYFEIYMRGSSTNCTVTFTAKASTPTRPSKPSVSLMVKKISK